EAKASLKAKTTEDLGKTDKRISEENKRNQEYFESIRSAKGREEYISTQTQLHNTRINAASQSLGLIAQGIGKTVESEIEIEKGAIKAEHEIGQANLNMATTLTENSAKNREQYQDAYNKSLQLLDSIAHSDYKAHMLQSQQSV